MILPREYKFTLPVSDRFKDAGYRDLFFRLLTNKMTEECARSLRLEGTRLDFKTSVLTGRTWFKAGWIQLRTDETPLTIECVLSIRRLSLLLPSIACLLMIVSLISPEMLARGSAIAMAVLYLGIAVMGVRGSIERFKELIQQQIAAADSEASLRTSILPASA